MNNFIESIEIFKKAYFIGTETRVMEFIEHSFMLQNIAKNFQAAQDIVSKTHEDSDDLGSLRYYYAGVSSNKPAITHCSLFPKEFKLDEGYLVNIATICRTAEIANQKKNEITIKIYAVPDAIINRPPRESLMFLPYPKEEYHTFIAEIENNNWGGKKSEPIGSTYISRMLSYCINTKQTDMCILLKK